LAGWLARYYSRVALPNGLVRRLRKNAIPKLKKIFDKKYGENNISGYEFITSISMKNEPNCEIKDGEYYKFELFILCKDQNSANIFDLELINIFENEISTFDGIKFEIRVQSEDQTLMSDFRGYVRFSEWDYLSPMWETATNPVA
ncbi:MAG: hypothetical protein KGJ29_03265, partial [Hyphomicrobiales bacterium]|nr:hypothetical protein [Hyphomicrobiales bacterium]